MAEEIAYGAKELPNASFCGVIIFYILVLLTDPVIAAVAGIMTATGIRLLAIKYDWNLPKARIS